MDYSEFLAEDFLAEESFQNWYLQRNQKDIDFWDRWIKSNPQCRPQIDQALLILDRFHEIPPSDKHQDLTDSWTKLKTLMDKDASGQKNTIKSTKFHYLTWAALLFLAAVSIAFWISFKSKNIIHHTDFGETKSITLPDNSVVTLNSNSKLTYSAQFGQHNGDRVIWLQGEAYFSVVPTLSNQKFTVYTADQVMVEVLGTEFNVKSRESGTKVVLNSGKISLSLTAEGEKINMEPGELVAISQYEAGYQKTMVNTDLYTSWKCKLLVFDNTPLREVTNILAENYGLQVKVADASLMDLKVSGTVPSDNIKLLLEGLAESFGLSILHTRNAVSITKKIN